MPREFSLTFTYVILMNRNADLDVQVEAAGGT